MDKASDNLNATYHYNKIAFPLNWEKMLKRGGVILKRKYNILFAIILIGLFSAYSPSDKDKTDDNETNEIFTGNIETIEDQNAIVDIEAGEILKSGRKVSVNLSVTDNTMFQVGDEFRVGYDGEVRESEPLQINTTFVELIE